MSRFRRLIIVYIYIPVSISKIKATIPLRAHMVKHLTSANMFASILTNRELVQLEEFAWFGSEVEECCEELEEGVASFVFPARKGVTRDGEPLGY